MKQMEGLKFRRKQPIDNYIVDFVCFENRIIFKDRNLLQLYDRQYGRWPGKLGRGLHR